MAGLKLTARNTYYMQEFIYDSLLTVAFCLMINSLYFTGKEKESKKESKINEELAAFSYTLYLLH